MLLVLHPSHAVLARVLVGARTCSLLQHNTADGRVKARLRSYGADGSLHCWGTEIRQMSCLHWNTGTLPCLGPGAALQKPGNRTSTRWRHPMHLENTSRFTACTMFPHLFHIIYLRCELARAAIQSHGCPDIPVRTASFELSTTP